MELYKDLAIHGGIPVREKYLPYGRQWLDEEDIQSVVNVLQGDYLTTGPAVEGFEQSIAAYVGAKYAVAFANGTAALHGACFAAGIKQGDEVITSPLTFAASANCILYLGGTPVFADIDPLTLNIDPAAIEKLITPRTKAILPVDFAGNPVDLDTIQAIARKHHLVVIEDAAHALGASYKNRKIGAISDMTMFSFHPVKSITSGEGGIITTDQEEYYRKLKQFRTHGITREADQLREQHGPWYYEMQTLGYNYRITDIQAALGSSQLKKLDSFIQIRRCYAETYTRTFQTMPEITCPQEPPSVSSAWHLYVIRLNLDYLGVERKEIFEALIQENIGVNVHYIPVYYHPYYRELGYPTGLCPQTEKIYQGIITLPLFPAMTEQDLEDVIRALKKVIHYYRR
ncbi:MAG: UDP-4-amino-4,6-dideoxy-N-acetyl-beta-L-altrosamine transaminase [Gracilibacter sp. BRH_c7a]|nr:MAG: UDP-4-amino-4,6-dideoxy-N-acetyl-beta-L-altrosamine transaminase [Gracilibacter sp. BRH_c7a]